jgi:queuosine precursor transporter
MNVGFFLALEHSAGFEKNMLNKQEANKVVLNVAQCQCLIFLSMLYLSLMLCNAIFTNRWISLGHDFVFGGAFVSPLLFILGDIIAEIFGYKIAKNMIWFAFICQTVFAILCETLIATPFPSTWHEEHAYVYVFGSLLRIDISGFVAFFTSNILNILIITRWKIIVRGRLFWLRSLGSSTIAEACYSAIAILMIGFGSFSFHTMFRIILITYFIKVSYSVILAYPGNMLVNSLKQTFKIDIYDTVSHVNPFKVFANKQANLKV